MSIFHSSDLEQDIWTLRHWLQEVAEQMKNWPLDDSTLTLEQLEQKLTAQQVCVTLYKFTVLHLYVECRK